MILISSDAPGSSSALAEAGRGGCEKVIAAQIEALPSLFDFFELQDILLPGEEGYPFERVGFFFGTFDPAAVVSSFSSGGVTWVIVDIKKAYGGAAIQGDAATDRFYQIMGTDSFEKMVEYGLASKVRKALAAGQQLQYLKPAVVEYILNNGLYETRGESGTRGDKNVKGDYR